MNKIEFKNDQIKQILINTENRLENILTNKLIRIILYGSYARGTSDAESDIDIIALTSLEDEEIAQYRDKITDLSAELSFESGLFISILVKNYQKFYDYIEYVPFYNAIAKEGIIIHG
jgi:uncharacterized protein